MFNESAGGTEKLEHFKVKKSLRFRSSGPGFLQKTLITATSLGLSTATTYNLTINSDTNNYVLYDAAKAAGYDGYSLCTVNLTINPGIKLSSVKASLPALDIRGFPVGCILSVTVSTGAYIVGQGGAGGSGGDSGHSMGSDGKFNRPGDPGEDGGDAIWTNCYVTIYNSGTIAGGGGGGGGGAGVHAYGPGGGGGGGGAGGLGGLGGLGRGWSLGGYYGDNGQPGTFSGFGLGGVGGSNEYGTGGTGGTGGAWGTAGAVGGDSTANDYPYTGPGGAAGRYVVGNNYVTWNGNAGIGPTAAAANSKRWTTSFWCKRGKLGIAGILQGGSTSGVGGEHLFFDADDRLNWVNYQSGYKFSIKTDSQHRDPSAWFHIMAVCDITNTNVNDRLKIYLNGQRQSITYNVAGVDATTQSAWGNVNFTQYIGKGYDCNFDGYLAELHFIDGVALTPTSFGRTDYKTGEWIPRKYIGTYGTLGFYLPFTDNRYVNQGNNICDGLGFDQKYKTARFITPGGTTFTIPKYSKNITIEAWGAGAGGAGAGSSSQVVISKTLHPGLANDITMIAGGGGPGTGGTASGATTIVNGNNNSGSNGGSGPQGGGLGGSGTLSGVMPGGGGGGGSGTGGGSGAYVRQTFVPGDLTPGNYITLAIGFGGSAGSGGAGGHGMVQITVDGGIPNNWYIPFSASISADSSSYNYDSMLDSPTATGNNVGAIGNYCVWNSAYPGASSIGNGGLSISSGRVAVGTISVTKGKWYYEVRTGSATGTAYPVWGIHDLSHNKNVNYYPGESSTAWGIGVGTYTVDGKLQVYLNNNNSYTRTDIVTDPSGIWSVGDIIMIAFDADTGKFWAGRNGVWYKNSSGNRGDPANGVNPLATYTVKSTSVFAPGGSVYDSTISYANFGQQPFRGAYVSGSGNTYTGSGLPPTGFRPLCTNTIANTQIYKGNKFFKIITRSGTGSSTTISGLGFQPNFIWTKIRNDTGNNYLIDSLRGTGRLLTSNSTTQEVTGGIITGFNNDGYTVDSSQNASGKTYVDWVWRAGNANVTNASGTNNASLASVYSVNNLSKFSIVTYTGTGQAGTVAHGLGVKPDFMIVKNRTTDTTNWPVFHKDQGAVNIPYLEDQTPFFTRSGVFNNTLPTNQVFSVGDYNPNNLSNDARNTNKPNDNYVAYCWAEVPGFSKFGSYTGNGDPDGPFIYCGFRPRYILFKSVETANYWAIIDTSRNTFNVANAELNTNLPAQELAMGGDSSTNVDILSNGFKMRGLVSNPSSAKVIFAAFAESPFKYANSR